MVRGNKISAAQFVAQLNGIAMLLTLCQKDEAPVQMRSLLLLKHIADTLPDSQAFLSFLLLFNVR